MKYRYIQIDKDKYKESIISDPNIDEDSLFSIKRDEAGKAGIILPVEYDALSTRGQRIISIGKEKNCTIRLNSDATRVTITGAKLDADEYIFVNGRPEKKGNLIPGDKLLIDTTEIIYHAGWIEICGVRGKTYDTDLMTYIDKPKRFDEYPIYKRSPRIIKAEPHAKVQIKAPDKIEKQRKGELIKRILPSCVMIVATVLMSIFMNRGLYMMVMVAATGATMIITVVTYFDDRKTKARENKERVEAYNQYLLEKRKELYEKTEKFKEAKSYQNPSLTEIESEVRHYTNRIYERNLIDEDFLTVSLGTAPGLPGFTIECDTDGLGRRGDRQYQEMLAVYHNFRSVEDVPYVIDLKKSHLGIVGSPEYCRERLRAITAQIAFFQSYHDVCIVPVISEENSAEYEWMRWLPHTNIKSINVSGVISGENQRDQVLGHITRELKARSMTRDDSRKETRFAPHYVFLIDEPKLIINHSIMEHLKEEGADLGFTLIYTTQLENNLPENVKTILIVEASEEGTVLMNEGNLVNGKVFFDKGIINYELFARSLKPLVHNKGVTTQIPESITFFELYDAKTPEEIEIKERWKQNATHKSLSVPLGVRGKGDIVDLDLHERAHGPHGLVAGTTGSGKSEILQSYILSLACNFHPHDVGFLLIDYKGGGMANLFTDLPHLLGTITNLDGSESMRALASIKSELKRRQDVFNKNGVNNINKYSEKFRAGEATEPMPHLFIISDEFAELKKEQPEFMAELVSTARVGRSLGVHLILATQKPTGVVDDQIWSNSRFKLCLKVQDESDSRELLKTGDAANITQPGRAYLQVGNNEIFELFQSAYSGGSYSKDKEDNEVDNRIYVLNELGQGKLINDDLSSGDASDINKLTQLDAVVQHIKAVYEEKPCVPVEKPWLPPLETEIVNPYISDIKQSDIPDVSFAVGNVDMPDRQKQEVYIHDFSKAGNIAVFGTSKVGKSTAATNAILSLCAKNTPEALNVYIVDFGNAALFGLKDLPQVADYVSFDDGEKFRKLRNILADEISDRKRKFAKANVTTLELYNENAKDMLPAIVLIVDNYDVVKEIDYDLENYFTQLTRDGIGVGIYTFVTATRANAMKYAVLNNFGVRVCNFLADSSEISSLIGRSEYKLTDVKGRALINMDSVYLMQEFLPAPIADLNEYRNTINEMVTAIAGAYSGRAKSIPMLPEKLEYYDLIQRKGTKSGIALGLDGEDVSVKYVDSPGVFLVVGSGGSGKTNLLRIAASQTKGENLFIFDSRSEDLDEYKSHIDTRYMSNEEETLVFLNTLIFTLEDRKRNYDSSNKSMKAKDFYKTLEPLSICIDDVSRFLSVFQANEKEMVDVLAMATDMNATIFASTVPNQISGLGQLAKYFKDTKNGIVLGNPADQSYLTPGLRQEAAVDIGYLYNNGTISKLKLPLV